jgi:hypothetical protein
LLPGLPATAEIRIMATNFEESVTTRTGLPLRLRITRLVTSTTGTADHYKGGLMATDIEELTVTYVEDGIETIKELDKQVLTKGAWSTIIYRYQDWNRAKEEYGPDKYTIRRYQKRNGEYQQKSKFNISSKDQAEKIIAALQDWIK